MQAPLVSTLSLSPTSSPTPLISRPGHTTHIWGVSKTHNFHFPLSPGILCSSHKTCFKNLILETYFIYLFFGVTLRADIAAMLHPRHSYNNNNLKQFCNFHQSNITRWIRLIRNLKWQDWRHHVSICEHLVMIIERKHCKCTVAKTLLVSRFLRNMSIAAADQSGHCISPMFQVRFGKIGYWQLWVSGLG